MNSKRSKDYILLLLTSGFPFGTGESFLSEEIKFLHENFRKVIIISQNINGTQRQILPGDIKVYRYNPESSFIDLVILPIKLLRSIPDIYRLVYNESNYRRNTDFKLGTRHLILLAKRSIKAIQLKDFVSKVLKQEKKEVNVVFYSYWFNTAAHAISLINNDNSFKIVRAHGSDLYEEKSPQHYLPFQNFVLSRIDFFSLISENGYSYLSERFPGFQEKFFVSRLGVILPNREKVLKKTTEEYLVVSCSNLIKLKRVNLIIDALASLKSGKKIKWIHFGTGPEQNALLEMANSKLGENNSVKFEFMGHLLNSEILEFYSENYVDLFINTSSTEGIPVSIMEAMAYGIPSLATDVGGVKEIVTEKTGILIDPDSTAEKIADLIELFLDRSAEEIHSIRNNCYDFVMMNYSAENNYDAFIKKVNSILAAKNAGYSNNEDQF